MLEDWWLPANSGEKMKQKIQSIACLVAEA